MSVFVLFLNIFQAAVGVTVVNKKYANKKQSDVSQQAKFNAGA